MKEYQEPVVEAIEFQVQDVVTTSSTEEEGPKMFSAACMTLG